MAAEAKEDAKVQPLVIFYDSEAANGNVYCGDIIEIAAKCHPDVVKGSFQSLINTKQPLCVFATRDCGLSEEDLKNKPCFREVLLKFLSWIDNMVKVARKKHGKQFLPVLCAHYGYQFDFLILLSNMEKSGLHHSILTQHNVHFADSLVFCRKLKDNGEKLLANTRLSLDALYKKLFPRKLFKDRHRAMGDVDGMVKIFTQTPLRKHLHNMKYSSTKERLEYYISQSATKQQQAILEEKLCKLDACSKNMSIKKLLREGITYNTLRKIFEDCYSFFDFYEVMKTNGIERKVSKVMALHFSGLGLQNQGAIAYSRLHEEKPNQVAAERQGYSNRSPCDHCERKPQPNTTTQDSLQDDNPPNQEDGTEDWEREVTTAASPRGFTLKCTTPAPLSLVLDDLSCARSEKTRGVESQKSTVNPEIARLQLKSEVDHSLSGKHGSKNTEVTGKKQQGKSARAVVRSGSTHSVPNAAKQRVEGTVKWKKPFKEIKQDGRLPKKDNFSKRDSKREVTKKQSKAISLSEKHKHATGNKPSIYDLFSNEMKPENELEERPFKGHCSSAECSVGKSQLTVVAGLDYDSSTTDSVQKFASVFIGDIAILVPVECGEIDSVSNVTELNKPDSHVQDHTKRASCTKENPVVDNARVDHSPLVPLETHVEDLAKDDTFNYGTVVDCSQHNSEAPAGNAAISVLSISQSERDQSRPQSPYRPPETIYEEQAEANTMELNGDIEVIDTSPNFEPSEEDAIISSWVTSNIRSEQGTSDPQSPFQSVEAPAPGQAEVVRSSIKESSGSAMILDQVVSHVVAEKINDSTYSDGEVSGSNNFIPPANESNGGHDVVQEADHRVVTSTVDTVSVNGQDPAYSVISYLCHDESTTEGNNGPISSWADMPVAYLPDDVLTPLSHIQEPSFGSFGLNQEFATDLLDNDSANQGHRDLQAELSSESSSTSGDHSVDVHVFSRQPPLGEERGYTPDAVQQQPNQLPFAWNANDGIPQLHPGAGFSHTQAPFPSPSNPHGTFHQAYHALPLLKPCYPAFAYSSHVRPVIPPHVMPQHPQQVFMPPFQYRNQMMFSNVVPASVGFPAVSQSQFQPPMFPFLQASAGFPCFTHVNPYEQVRQAAGPPADVDGLVFTNSADAISQGSPILNYCPISTMDSNSSQGCDVKEDNSSDSSSSDSSFEQIVTSPPNQVKDDLTLAHESFPAQTEDDLGYSVSVAFKNSQKEKSPESGDNSDCQVFTLAQLCYREVSSDNISLNKLKDSEGFTSHHHFESQEDPVHKQITILSREEMGRRLSPDGSSVEGVCLDSTSGDTNAVQNDKIVKGKSASLSNWENLSGEYCVFRPTDIKEQEKEKIIDSGSSTKPQRVKGKRSRRDKSTQASSVLVSSPKNLQPGSELSDTCPNVNGPVTSNGNNKNSYKQDLGLDLANSTSQHSKTKFSHSRQRFLKEDSKLKSREASAPRDTPRQLFTRQEKKNTGIESAQGISRLTCNEDQDINDLEGKHRRSKDRSFAKTSNADSQSVREARKNNRPQQRTEKRVDMHLKKAPDAWKRGLSDKIKKPYKDKLSSKGCLEDKVPQTGARTDNNNNS